MDFPPLTYVLFKFSSSTLSLGQKCDGGHFLGSTVPDHDASKGIADKVWTLKAKILP